jgi:hypothetical protein
LATTSITCPSGLITTEIATVQSIADQDFKCLATSNARAILKQVIRKEYPIEFNINSVRSAPSTVNQESFSKPDLLLGNAMPNPTTGIVTIPYDLGKLDQGMLKIVDITGRIVNTQLINQSQGLLEVDLSNFANGVYSYQLWIDNGLFQSMKLVLQK